MAKFGFLFAKLNLRFGFGVVLKNLLKDLKHIFFEKMCRNVLNCLSVLNVK